MNRFLITLLVLSFLVGCSGKKKKLETKNPRPEIVENLGEDPHEKYRLLFSKIDNLAKVYVNNELIFDSQFIEGNPDLSITLGLSEHFEPGTNKVKIELYNGNPEVLESLDESWEVYYEIFRDEEPIEFINESSTNGKSGLVFTKEYKLIAEDAGY